MDLPAFQEEYVEPLLQVLRRPVPGPGLEAEVARQMHHLYDFFRKLYDEDHKEMR